MLIRLIVEERVTRGPGISQESTVKGGRNKEFVGNGTMSKGLFVISGNQEA